MQISKKSVKNDFDKSRDLAAHILWAIQDNLPTLFNKVETFSWDNLVINGDEYYINATFERKTRKLNIVVKDSKDPDAIMRGKFIWDVSGVEYFNLSKTEWLIQSVKKFLEKVFIW